MDENRKTILFFLGQSQYDSMREMTNYIMKAFNVLGYKTVRIDLLQENWNEKLIYSIQTYKPYFFFGMNGWGYSLTYGDKSLYDALNTPFFAFFVDHPIYHLERLKANLNNYIVSFIDKTLVDDVSYFMDKPAFTNSFISHATMIKEFPKKEIKDRKIELLFAGSGGDPDLIRKSWGGFPSNIKKIMDDMSEIVISTDNRDLLGILESLFESQEIILGKGNREKLLTILAKVDKYTRAYRRKKIIESLIDLPITVYGNGWDYIQRKGKAKFLSPINTKELYSILEDTKLCLNMLPNFPKGGHERIFDSMINGTAVLTDESEYLKSNFNHGESILYYDFRDNELKEKIEVYIENQDLLQTIAINGYQITRENHTWLNRARKIIDIVELHTPF